MNLLRELDQDDRVMSGAIMTTFPFAPQFFERTVLPALSEKQADEAIAILADSDHYDTTLDGDEAASNPLHQQQYPQAAGQGYHLAPVEAGPQRAFHPKVHYLTGKRRVQATVTSANLTHPGFTANQEVATRVTVSAPDEDTPADDNSALDYRTKAALCRDVADFFTSLTASSFGRSIDPVTQETIETVCTAGDWIEDIPAPAERTTQLLHTLDQPLLPQVREWLTARGETIEAVDIAAPFYGTTLDVPEQFTDEGIETRLWLQQGRTQIATPALETWLDTPTATAQTYDANRYVHGKVLRLQTDGATYVLSGSPNASRAALLTAAPDGGNVEAAVCRRYPDPRQAPALFETAPFTDAEPIVLDAFEPGSGAFLQGDTDEPTGQTDEPVFELYGVSYRRKDSYDGGTLIVTACADEAVRETIEDQGLTVHVTPPGATDEEAATERLAPHKIEWETETSPASFTATTELYGAAADRPFAQTGIAHLECESYTTDSRWVQTRSPRTGEPAADDIEDAGATAVPRTLTRLYQDDNQATTIESLNGLLAALRSAGGTVDPDTDDETGTGDADEDDQQTPTGGLSVREWSQSGSDDPSDLLESFFDGWEADLEAAYSGVSADIQYLETVETRLTAINATTLQLLVLDDARTDIDVPRQLALNTVKNVYTQQGLDDQLDSLLGDYCAVCQLYADTASSDEETDAIYTGLRTQILPQILLAAIIAQAHIAGDRATYFNQQDWAFEQLANECFPTGQPTTADLEPDRIDECVTTIWESIAGVRDRIAGSRQLRRHADERYLEKDQLRWAVLELLGRCLLLAGDDAMAAVQTTPQQSEHLDRVYEECREYLPAWQ